MRYSVQSPLDPQAQALRSERELRTQSCRATGGSSGSPGDKASAEPAIETGNVLPIARKAQQCTHHHHTETVARFDGKEKQVESRAHCTSQIELGLHSTHENTLEGSAEDRDRKLAPCLSTCGGWNSQRTGCHERNTDFADMCVDRTSSGTGTSSGDPSDDHSRRCRRGFSHVRPDPSAHPPYPARNPAPHPDVNRSPPSARPN